MIGGDFLARYTSGISKKRGLKPGSLVHVGKRTGNKTKISVMDYKGDYFKEEKLKSIEECFKYKDTDTVTWINIDGLEDITLYEKLGKEFGIHPLIMEDILNTHQRPKIEEFENYAYIVLKMIYYSKNDIVVEQLSLICMKNIVITFQEQGATGDVFENLRNRLRTTGSKIRTLDVGYLSYTLIDSIVDNYFLVLEKLEDRIEAFEDLLIASPTNKVFTDIYDLKREMIFIRKAVWPLREVINALQRGEYEFIAPNMYVYFKDIYDHTIQVIDSIELFRDIIEGMLDTYLSSVSNKMNEVMKFLTIFSTIFAPLAFLVGVYGMNFDNMPELKWHYAYPALWCIMVLITVTMLMYFKKKKWL